MKYKQRYKEVFSQIHPAKEFDWEKMYMKKRSRTISKQIICVAAVVTVLTSLCLAAYVTNFFGLRDLLLPQQHEITLPNGPTENVGLNKQEQQTQLVDVISLVGFSDTAEAKATAEWQNFLENYDDGGALAQIGNGPTGFGEDYGLYLVYTQEMADKLDEITAKYGLNLHSSMMIAAAAELFGQVGGNFCEDHQFGSAYLYEDGTFGMITAMSDYFPNFIKGLCDFFITGDVKADYNETIAIMGIIEASAKARKQPLTWVEV